MTPIVDIGYPDWNFSFENKYFGKFYFYSGHISNMIVFFTKLRNISIYVSLEENTGTYTFSAEQIQELINGIPADGLRAEVSQMDFGEVAHENGTIRTAMRNGNSVMMRIQE